ncbi:glycoside hydrolase family 3 C-terminal domain-containing protein [Listeria seeligeri]|uniref:glycoside hydrolase family 3 N-terminal domain-containing protein n=1 Tax=Listeria seeligeri TaxID=1640 RepID=UPI0016267574|nr:glycoside hydrolase family 3 N-terminal domain-containing protein [Listeria seeligeri]MBC1735511.1 beta-glucosidase [Listeria seeligeri]MBF2366610.1 glycoside hydrolase family 3 C-terminal domain-containing protein [Listeria seeligeri]MBF2540190.1 glycoside hydrolase family 3 C-terminal domain-containing protein [Listeria seeligeri]MBF2587024.1 glycoside hydrolase family 3 C-terminal domain-containing protein [Listeria seeligeri]MBF2606481.1 glycoside hydrolase family 3 C-terminal domain-co
MKQENLTALLAEMTLDEKIAQCLQLSPFLFKGAKENVELTGPVLQEMKLTDTHTENAGSVLGSSSAEDMLGIQEAYLKTNRLGIPLIFMADVIHGYKTVFPIPLALGCSFDRETVRTMAEVAALEATADGHHVTFSPMLDLVRDPRWGRVMESTGEDPFLNSELGKAMVAGYQGDANKLNENKANLAACVKHFAAYGAAEAGLEYNTVNMSTRELYQNYLPAYEAAIHAGAKLVMTAFNVVDGVPATMNKWLNRDVLRKEMNFDGVLISDWGAVAEVINHGTARNPAEAAQFSMEAGVDMEMMTTCYIHELKSLIEANKLSESLVDEAVLRILQLKNDLGLFEDPYRGLKEKSRQTDILTPENRRKSREAGLESAVLLENKKQILPLAETTKIALIGPLATSNDILGGWNVYGDEKDGVNVETGLQEVFSELITVSTDYTTFTEEDKSTIAKAIQASEVVVLSLGEKNEWGGEAGSLATIRLPEAQYDLAKYVQSFGKPVVITLFNGRPLEVKELAEASDALLELWFPGTEAGRVTADLLVGKSNPSGKLSMSFPQTTGQIPVYYNHLRTGRPQTEANKGERYVSHYLDIPNEPYYPFGYGKSYSEFEWKTAELPKQIQLGESLEVKVTLKNKSQIAGKEVIQIYVQDVTATISRPVKELKAFEKVALQPGEEKTVTFKLTSEAFSFYNHQLEKVQEPGLHRIFVGTSSENVDTFEVEVGEV